MPSGGGAINDVVGSSSRPVASEAGSAEDWDEFVVASGGPLAQTWAWGEIKRESGWSPVRVAVSDSGRIVGGAQILVRQVSALGSIGYLDGGPLALDATSTVVAATLDAIESACRAHHVRALSVDPPEDESVDRAFLESAGYFLSQIKTSLGATVRVPLGDEDDMLSAMKSKTRYNIRKGLRSGVAIRRGDASDLGIFHRLLESTAERNGFIAPSSSYLEAMWSQLAPLGRLAMFLADVEGETVGATLVTAFGDTVVYKRGAWDGRHGRAHPNEVLHWEAMRWARDSGFEWYDFDGIEREVAEALVAGEDPEALESVTRFKLGFGGQVVLLPTSLTLVPNAVLRAGYRVGLPWLLRFRSFRRLIRTLRSR